MQRRGPGPGPLPYEGSADPQRHPIHEAADNLNIAALRALIDSGTNVNLRDRFRNTALHSVLDPTFKDKELRAEYILAAVFALVSARADINAKNVHGSSPIHIACSYYPLAVVKALIDQPFSPARAELGARDNKGQTPLHCAAAAGSFEVVEWLLKARRAPATIRDGQGHTPLDVARRCGRTDIVQLLMAVTHPTPVALPDPKPDHRPPQSERSAAGSVRFSAAPPSQSQATAQAVAQAIEDTNLAGYTTIDGPDSSIAGAEQSSMWTPVSTGGLRNFGGTGIGAAAHGGYGAARDPYGGGAGGPGPGPSSAQQQQQQQQQPYYAYTATAQTQAAPGQRSGGYGQPQQPPRPATAAFHPPPAAQKPRGPISAPPPVGQGGATDTLAAAPAPAWPSARPGSYAAEAATAAPATADAQMQTTPQPQRPAESASPAYEPLPAASGEEGPLAVPQQGTAAEGPPPPAPTDPGPRFGSQAPLEPEPPSTAPTSPEDAAYSYLPPARPRGSPSASPNRAPHPAPPSASASPRTLGVPFSGHSPPRDYTTASFSGSYPTQPSQYNDLSDTVHPGQTMASFASSARPSHHPSPQRPAALPPPSDPPPELLMPLARLEAEVFEWRSRVESSEAERRTALEAMRAAQEQVQSLEDERRHLLEDKSKSQDLTRALASRVRDSEEALGREREVVGALRSQVKEADEALAASEAEAAALRRANKNYKSGAEELLAHLQAMEAEMRKLQESESEAKRLRAELSSLVLINERLARENGYMKQKIDSLSAFSPSTNRHLDRRTLGELAAENTALTEEIAALRDEVEVLRSSSRARARQLQAAAMAAGPGAGGAAGAAGGALSSGTSGLDVTLSALSVSATTVADPRASFSEVISAASQPHPHASPSPRGYTSAQHDHQTHPRSPPPGPSPPNELEALAGTPLHALGLLPSPYQDFDSPRHPQQGRSPLAQDRRSSTLPASLLGQARPHDRLRSPQRLSATGGAGGSPGGTGTSTPPRVQSRRASASGAGPPSSSSPSLYRDQGVESYAAIMAKMGVIPSSATLAALASVGGGGGGFGSPQRGAPLASGPSSGVHSPSLLGSPRLAEGASGTSRPPGYIEVRPESDSAARRAALVDRHRSEGAISLSSGMAPSAHDMPMGRPRGLSSTSRSPQRSPGGGGGAAKKDKEKGSPGSAQASGGGKPPKKLVSMPSLDFSPVPIRDEHLIDAPVIISPKASPKAKPAAAPFAPPAPAPLPAPGPGPLRPSGGYSTPPQSLASSSPAPPYSITTPPRGSLPGIPEASSPTATPTGRAASPTPPHHRGHAPLSGFGSLIRTPGSDAYKNMLIAELGALGGLGAYLHPSATPQGSAADDRPLLGLRPSMGSRDGSRSPSPSPSSRTPPGPPSFSPRTGTLGTVAKAAMQAAASAAGAADRAASPSASPTGSSPAGTFSNMEDRPRRHPLPSRHESFGLGKYLGPSPLGSHLASLSPPPKPAGPGGPQPVSSPAVPGSPANEAASSAGDSLISIPSLALQVPEAAGDSLKRPGKEGKEGETVEEQGQGPAAPPPPAIAPPPPLEAPSPAASAAGGPSPGGAVYAAKRAVFNAADAPPSPAVNPARHHGGPLGPDTGPNSPLGREWYIANTPTALSDQYHGSDIEESMHAAPEEEDGVRILSPANSPPGPGARGRGGTGGRGGGGAGSLPSIPSDGGAQLLPTSSVPVGGRSGGGAGGRPGGAAAAALSLGRDKDKGSPAGKAAGSGPSPAKASSFKFKVPTPGPGDSSTGVSPRALGAPGAAAASAAAEPAAGDKGTPGKSPSRKKLLSVGSEGRQAGGSGGKGTKLLAKAGGSGGAIPSTSSPPGRDAAAGKAGPKRQSETAAETGSADRVAPYRSQFDHVQRRPAAQSSSEAVRVTVPTQPPASPEKPLGIPNTESPIKDFDAPPAPLEASSMNSWSPIRPARSRFVVAQSIEPTPSPRATAEPPEPEPSEAPDAPAPGSDSHSHRWLPADSASASINLRDSMPMSVAEAVSGIEAVLRGSHVSDMVPASLPDSAAGAYAADRDLEAFRTGAESPEGRPLGMYGSSSALGSGGSSPRTPPSRMSRDPGGKSASAAPVPIPAAAPVPTTAVALLAARAALAASGNGSVQADAPSLAGSAPHSARGAGTPPATGAMAAVLAALEGRLDAKTRESIAWPHEHSTEISGLDDMLTGTVAKMISPQLEAEAGGPSEAPAATPAAPAAAAAAALNKPPSPQPRPASPQQSVWRDPAGHKPVSPARVTQPAVGGVRSLSSSPTRGPIEASMPKPLADFDYLPPAHSVDGTVGGPGASAAALDDLRIRDLGLRYAGAGTPVSVAGNGSVDGGDAWLDRSGSDPVDSKLREWMAMQHSTYP